MHSGRYCTEHRLQKLIEHCIPTMHSLSTKHQAYEEHHPAYFPSAASPDHLALSSHLLRACSIWPSSAQHSYVLRIPVTGMEASDRTLQSLTMLRPEPQSTYECILVCPAMQHIPPVSSTSLLHHSNIATSPFLASTNKTSRSFRCCPAATLP